MKVTGGLSMASSGRSDSGPRRGPSRLREDRIRHVLCCIHVPASAHQPSRRCEDDLEVAGRGAVSSCGGPPVVFRMSDCVDTDSFFFQVEESVWARRFSRTSSRQTRGAAPFQAVLDVCRLSAQRASSGRCSRETTAPELFLRRPHS
jgi:hypothetical protein